MANRSRKFNVLFNSIFGVLATMISTIMTFAVRTVLSRCLGEEIYGLNTLFASIITTLLIMELGMSTAMLIYLYEPVATGNNEKVKSIIRLYRNVYRGFCGILMLAGISVDIVILPYMVTSLLPMAVVRFYFLIFLISIVIKYLWSYKRSILLANQQNRVSSGVTAVCEAIFGLIEICVIIKTKNYCIYLFVLIAQNLMSNYICNTIINKRYMFIMAKNVSPLSKDEKYSIFNTVKPMFVQRIAGVVQDSSIAVILSFMSESIATVGFYGNYQLVVHTAQSLYSQIGAAFATSFGNFFAMKKREECYLVYRKSRFIMNWLTAIISICFMQLVQMFIDIFWGEKYVLNFGIVVLLTLYLYGYLNNVILISIQNAMGLHYLDVKQMLYQTVLNIVLSIGGGFVLGLEGIILGSFVSMFIFSTLYKGSVIYENVFNQTKRIYLKSLCNEYVRFIFSGACVYFLMCRLLSTVSVITWLVRAVVVFVVSNITFLIFSLRNPDIKYMKKEIEQMLRKVKN